MGKQGWQRALHYCETHLEDYIDEVVRLSEVPAPTFAEAERAAHVHRRMVELGLQQVETDALGNVLGRLPGRAGERGPVLLIAAHLDTVFPAGTDCRVKRQRDRLSGPGVGDNASNLAGMLFAVQAMQTCGVRLEHDILCVATVGEEGLGDLRGIKHVLQHKGLEVASMVALDGGLGALVHQGIGSRRYRVTCRCEGGHSWGAFGAPSAIHALGRIIARISYLEVPQEPRTTYNVGWVEGGTSVNTIAAEAAMLLDLRSVDQAELARLEQRVRAIWEDVAGECRLQVSAELVGNRPSGSIPADHPLVRAVRRVHDQLGIRSRMLPSSTDANVALSRGIPAVTIGVTVGQNSHRTDEFIWIEPAVTGLQQLLRVLDEIDRTPALWTAPAVLRG